MRKTAPITLILLIAMTACGGGGRRVKREAKYGAGIESHKVDGLIQVDISEVRVKKNKLYVKLTVRNLGDKELRFPLSSVHLDYNGKKLTPQERGWSRDPEVDVKVGKAKNKAYIFDAEPKGTSVLAGEYEFVFAGIHTVGGAGPAKETTGSGSPGGGPAPTTTANELRFKLKVP